MQEECREGSLYTHCQESRSLLGEAGQTGTWDSRESRPILLRVLIPDRAQLGYQKGNEEGGDGGKEQGAWESAEVGYPKGA